jgi:GH35 family endo-1,4-beta-xylanase
MTTAKRKALAQVCNEMRRLIVGVGKHDCRKSQIVRAWLNNAGCTAIQTWGFTDKYSWIGSHSHGTRGQALPFDRTDQPKSAYRALLEELSAGRQRKSDHQADP